MNCQLGQGYLFSKSINKKEVDELIETILHFSQQYPGEHYPLCDELLN
jgi:hypothetical protein